MTWETASPVLVRETASLDLGPDDPMDLELEDNSNQPTLCGAAGIQVDTMTVVDRDTSVFRPTQLVYDDAAAKHFSGAGQSEAHFVTLTVPPPNRPILLHRNGRPFEPLPCSRPSHLKIIGEL